MIKFLTSGDSDQAPAEGSSSKSKEKLGDGKKDAGHKDKTDEEKDVRRSSPRKKTDHEKGGDGSSKSSGHKSKG